MACSNCGSENRPDARFCAACGTPTSVPTDERRVVSVLFADLVGFTSLSENLDPERVKGVVDGAFERLVADVNEFGGRVDKIVGDAIVALYGAPVAHEDDAERAVRAALRMHGTLADYAAESEFEIRMRIGVNTGEVLVGALRAGGDYTAMGDVVNTASRLQTSAAPGEVLVGEATYVATSEVIGYQPRGMTIVKGREAPIDVWAATHALVSPGYRSRRFAPLVGRESELSILQNAVELSIRHGRGQVILLLAEAGMGKTRLANEIGPAVLAIRPDAVVASGRCVPYGEANPWFPLAEAIREACGIAADDSRDQAAAKSAASVGMVIGGAESANTVAVGLMHLMGFESPLRSLEPASARGDTTAALHSFLDGWLKIRPVVVRLADLHWADDQVLELVDQMTERFAKEPLVFVATARRSLLRRWTPSAGRQNLLVLNLDPLDREAAGSLLDSMMPGDISEAIRSEILDRSGGNPLYLEELATLLSEQQGYREPDQRADVPHTLRGLIAARIDGLSSHEQHVVEDASVWGARGPLEALRQLGEGIHGDASIESTVESLVLKDVFVVEGEDWWFRSDIVREIAYSRLTKSERLRRHRLS